MLSKTNYCTFDCILFHGFRVCYSDYEAIEECGNMIGQSRDVNDTIFKIVSSSGDKYLLSGIKTPEILEEISEVFKRKSNDSPEKKLKNDYYLFKGNPLTPIPMPSKSNFESKKNDNTAVNSCLKLDRPNKKTNLEMKDFPPVSPNYPENWLGNNTLSSSQPTEDSSIFTSLR